MARSHASVSRRIARTKATNGQGHKRGRLWQAMRILRTFTVFDLQAVAEIDSKRSVLTFLSQLRRTGFIRATYGDGARHEPTRFVLVRNSGPTCPGLIRRGSAIYDHNTDLEYPIHDNA